jgi:site-specific DNA recombinase
MPKGDLGMTTSKAQGKAVAYIRVSAVMGREEMISPELQLFEIQSYAAKHNLKIVHEVHDIDQSGRSFTKRRVGEVIEGIKAGAWEHVILWKWSRWGRKLRESLVYLGSVEEAGGTVRAATEDFDPRTTTGKFTRDQFLLIAELQSNQIGDGWRETHAKRRRDGLPHSGHARLGYDYEKGVYRVNEEEAELVSDAYKRYARGGSTREIALEWNSRGLRTKRSGHRWSDTTVRLMLDTGFAAGWIRERSQPAQSGRRDSDFDVWRRGIQKPIISEELWEDYKAERQRRSREPVRLRSPKHALSGLLVCAECQYRMVAFTASPRKNARYLFWRCQHAYSNGLHPSNSISDLRAQSQVLSWIERESVGGDDTTEQARRIAEQETVVSDISRLEQEIAQLTRKRKKLADMHSDDLIDEEDYRDQRAEIKARIDLTSAAHREAQQRAATAGFDSVRAFRGLREEWEHLGGPARNQALRAVLSHITVHLGPFSPSKIEPVPKWAHT